MDRYIVRDIVAVVGRFFLGGIGMEEGAVALAEARGGRVEHGRCLLDLRCVPPETDSALIENNARVLAYVRAGGALFQVELVHHDVGPPVGAGGGEASGRAEPPEPESARAPSHCG